MTNTTSVTLTIDKCADCPHLRIGHGYSLDGFDYGNDWDCAKAKRSLVLSYKTGPRECQ